MNLSIITPSLNSEKYILNNLTSVHLEQEGDFYIEQIIVDGGSTDRTIEIIESFKERYDADITLIQGQDKSMYDAINTGLKLMKGAVWACLNTDDQYITGIIPLVVEEFNKNPEIEVVYGYLDKMDDNGKVLYTSYVPEFDLELFILMSWCCCMNHPSTFLRKAVIDKVGYFNITYNYASDYEYLIRVAVNCKMKLVHKSFTKFMIRSNSISCSETTQTIQKKESEEISKKYRDEFCIVQRNLFLDHLKLRLIQIRFKKLKYLFKNFINTRFHFGV